jgi:hypothetical protein
LLLFYTFFTRLLLLFGLSEASKDLSDFLDLLRLFFVEDEAKDFLLRLIEDEVGFLLRLVEVDFLLRLVEVDFLLLEEVAAVDFLLRLMAPPFLTTLLLRFFEEEADRHAFFRFLFLGAAGEDDDFFLLFLGATDKDEDFRLLFGAARR